MANYWDIENVINSYNKKWNLQPIGSFIGSTSAILSSNIIITFKRIIVKFDFTLVYVFFFRIIHIEKENLCSVWQHGT